MEVHLGAAQPNKKEEEEAASRPESPATKITSFAPSNLITKYARTLSEEEQEEQRLSQEKETNLVKQKRTEQVSKLAAANANQIMSPVISVKKVLMTTMASTKNNPITAISSRHGLSYRRHGGNKLW